MDYVLDRYVLSAYVLKGYVLKGYVLNAYVWNGYVLNRYTLKRYVWHDYGCARYDTPLSSEKPCDETFMGKSSDLGLKGLSVNFPSRLASSPQ